MIDLGAWLYSASQCQEFPIIIARRLPSEDLYGGSFAYRGQTGLVCRLRLRSRCWVALSPRLTDNSPIYQILCTVFLFMEMFMSIYIGNLPYQVTEDAVSEVFAEYGTVKRVQLPTDRETGRMRGFGFIEMSSEEEESAAIEALDGAEWMGRDLKVNKARPREQRPSSGNFGNNSNRRRNDRRY